MTLPNRFKAVVIASATILAGLFIAPAVTIDTVYFGQTHLQETTHPYFNLGGNRDTLIKAHVVDPGNIAAPLVQAVLTLDGNTLNLPLTGPAVLPVSIPNGLGVVQHSFANTFTGVIPKAWVKRGLSVSVQAGVATSNFNNMAIGAPTRVIMTMLDVHYFSQVTGDYPAGWREEIEAKWPVAELELRRLPNVVFPELVIPPRGTAPAARVKSQSDYTAQTGLGFDGEQAAALAWNGALKAAAGTSGRISLYYTNIYGVAAGGQAGGFGGVGTGTGVGILHHELGHALSLPHWGDSAAYPYKGDMHGITTPVGNPVHAGPNWGYDARLNVFIPCTTQPGNVGGKPDGTYKVDPMQGGGMGYQEPGFLLNHFSDYSVRQMRNYLEGHVLVWNQAQGKFAAWNSTTRDYTTTVTNNGVQYPLERDMPVISVMAAVSGAKPDVCMVYPPIGPYTTGLIRRFDPTVAADRTAAASIFAPSGGCDVCVRVTQGGVQKTYMMAAAWEPTLDPLSSSSLRTTAVNVPAADGPVTRVDLLYTPDAQINGLPANPQVLYSWPSSLTPVPAGLAASGGNAVVNLTWNSSPGATSYKIKRATVGGGPYTQIGISTTSAFNDTTVTNGVTYYYVVSAVGPLAESENSAQASGTPVPPPPAPTGLVATPGDSEIALTWNASPGASAYNVKRSSNSGGPYTAIASVAGTAFTDDTVINGLAYHYVVSAMAAGPESANSNQASATPVGVPAAPGDASATGGDQIISVSWTASPGATGYVVKRSSTSGGPYLEIATVSGTSHNDTDVINGFSYFYVISATNVFGEGVDSAEAVAASLRSRFWEGGSADIAGNGNGASNGGNGTWNTTLMNWDAGATPRVAWGNTANDAAVFAGTAGTVTLGSGVTAGGLAFNTSNYILTGQPLTFGTAGDILNPGTATLNCELAGAPTALIAKKGAGTLVLGGTNTWQGILTVHEGTVQFNSAAAIGGTGRSVLAADEVSLVLASAYVIDNAFLNRLVENDNVFRIVINSASSNDLDFSSATGAYLPNAVFMCTTGTGTGALTYNGNITPGGGAYRLGTGSGNRWIIANALTGSANSLVLSGGPNGVIMLNANPTYKGTTSIGSGMTLDLQALNLSNMGGGVGVRDISVAATGGVRRNTLDNAFLNRLVETTAEITVMTGTTSNNLDFSTGTGANLPNAFLGNYASNGAKAEYTGTLTPASDHYRLGSASSSGLLGIRSVLSGTQGLIVGGSRVNLVAANTFSGDTTIRSGAKLTIGNNLALRNSALDLGTAGGAFALAAGTNGSKILDETAAASPTFGGLKGSRDLLAVFTSTGGNNETNLAASAVTGFTLNPGAGMTCTYSGVIANFAVGTALTKTGTGTQTLNAANTYTGATTVSQGILSLGVDGSISNSASISIAAGAIFDTAAKPIYEMPGGQPVTFGLDATGSGSSGMISAEELHIENAAVSFNITGTLDDPVYVLATYSSLHGGSFASAPAPPPGYVLDYTYQDNKIALVQTITPYESWSGGAPFEGDANGDGVPNGIAWVIGASDPSSNATGLLPTFDSVGDLQGKMRFTFRRAAAAEADLSTTIQVQYGSDLTGWTEAEHEGTGPGQITILVLVDGFGPGIDRVTVALPPVLAQAGKLFARLNAVVTP